MRVLEGARLATWADVPAVPGMLASELICFKGALFASQGLLALA